MVAQLDPSIIQRNIGGSINRGSYMSAHVLLILLKFIGEKRKNVRHAAGKGLTSWLSFVVSNCEFVTFPLVSWVRCGT